MHQRSNRILSILSEQKRIEVSVLAQLVGVSQVTIRKDLDELESRGIIRREHGYATLGSNDDINGRLAFHYEVKQRIATEAAHLVRDGDTIMIESGSCCALLAEAIATHCKDVTIITNSAFIAGYVRRHPDIKVVLLGGFFQNDAQVMVGPMVKQCAENFLVDRLFIGTDGYTSRGGFTNSDHLRAEAVRDMAARAEQVIILTESVKFSRHGVVPLLLPQPVSLVITDSGIPAEMEAELFTHGTLVEKVPLE